MKFKCTLLLIISILMLKAFANDNPPANNFVLFGVNLEDFNTTNYNEFYSITPNESFGNIEVDKAPQNIVIVYADRKNSDTPSTWVQNGLASMNIPWEESYVTTPNVVGISHTPPSSLNFAILGTLRFFDTDKSNLYSCQNVYIAQGHDGGRNNWWVFNNNSVKPHSLFCHNITSNSDVYFEIKGDIPFDVAGFTLKLMQ